MFNDPRLRAKLGQLFSADTERFDELIAAAGLNPKTDLVGADLRGANFAGSIMNGWDLSGCDVTGASFIGARIRELKVENTIGLDLTGAVFLDDAKEDIEKTSDKFDWIVEQIRKSKNGADRGPLVESLLSDYDSDERTWSFLLEHQVRRERVGRIVSGILNAWEARQPNPGQAGIELRLQLLGERGNPYITVRARLLRELASRLGRNEKLLRACRDIIEAEGYLTSGVTALSILADVFAGDESVYAYLETLIARHDWQGFKYDVVPALLRGFDGARARQIVERGILDHSLGTYERSGMLNAYFRTKRSDPRVVAFAKQMLKANDEPEMRAAVFRAMTYFADALDSDELGRLREIVASDGDENLRIAALQLIGERQDQVDFVLERATAPDTNNIRSVAIGLAHDLGYRDSNWYAQIFAHDAADSIRSIALTHLISSVGEDELRTLLVREMERTDLGVAAARSAFEALNRWPNEPTIRKSVENMLERLPKEVGAWRNLLRTRLSRS